MWFTKSGFAKPSWSFEAFWLGAYRPQKTLFRTSHHLAIYFWLVDQTSPQTVSHSVIKVNQRAVLSKLSYLMQALIFSGHCNDMQFGYSVSTWVVLLTHLQTYPQLEDLRNSQQHALSSRTSLSELPWVFFHIFSYRRILESVYKFFEISHWQFHGDFTECID